MSGGVASRGALRPIQPNTNASFTQPRSSRFTKTFTSTNTWTDTTIHGATRKEEVEHKRAEYRRKKEEEKERRLSLELAKVEALKRALAEKKRRIAESRRKKRAIVEKYAVIRMQSCFRGYRGRRIAQCKLSQTDALPASKVALSASSL